MSDIIGRKWSKNWSGEFSILIDSYSVEFYNTGAKNIFGAGISESLYIHKNGMTTCFLPVDKLKKFGENLAQQAVNDDSIIVKWVNSLRKLTDEGGEMVKRPIEQFLELENYLEFYEFFSVYEPTQIGIKNMANYLPNDLIEKYFSLLEDARNYTAFLYDAVEDFCERLAKVLGEKIGYDYRLVISMTHDEIVDYLKTGKIPDKEILEKRYELSAIHGKDNEVHFIMDDVLELEKSILGESGSEIKGNIAYSGKVKGICRVILHPKRFDVFNKGEILVTTMTRPDFIPLMEKASAIVTDAGGILCHAAIFSRERKKPCVIGTEVATTVFKDGDMIEVDNGVVRKI